MGILGILICAVAIFVGTRGEYTSSGLGQFFCSLGGLALAIPGVWLALFAW